MHFYFWMSLLCCLIAGFASFGGFFCSRLCSNWCLHRAAEKTRACVYNTMISANWTSIKYGSQCLRFPCVSATTSLDDCSQCSCSLSVVSITNEFDCLWIFCLLLDLECTGAFLFPCNTQTSQSIGLIMTSSMFSLVSWQWHPYGNNFLAQSFHTGMWESVSWTICMKALRNLMSNGISSPVIVDTCCFPKMFLDLSERTSNSTLTILSQHTSPAIVLVASLPMGSLSSVSIPVLGSILGWNHDCGVQISMSSILKFSRPPNLNQPDGQTHNNTIFQLDVGYVYRAVIHVIHHYA